MTNEKTVSEPARQTPVAGEFDVIVCGAGPAGWATAIAAGKMGAKVFLIDVNGCLGGTWTAGLLGWLIDYQNKTGLMPQLVADLTRRGGFLEPGFDVEVMKLALEDWCRDAGVKVQLHTRAVAAQTDSAGRLTTVITESKSGRQAWRAHTFVDASGDGDLAAAAGCEYSVGRETDGQTQPMSLLGILAGVTAEEVAEFRNKKTFLAELERAGVTPSYSGPTLYPVRNDLFFFMANHEYGVAATDAAAITEATFRGRAEIHKLVSALRARGGVWHNLHPVATGSHIGVREGRRIHGRYTVNIDDMIAGKTHDDGICKVTFCIDVHSTDPAKSKGIEAGMKIQPYDIPLRSLIAKDVDHLLMAGRCISGDFLAHSSYRVAGNAVAMGQAAGVLAALSTQKNVAPHQIPYEDVKSRLATFD